jgi:two-component system nitrate/nitrite response regulator NarL
MELPDPTSGDQPEPIRVLLIDDHDLYRTGLRDLLAARGVAVAEAATGEDAVRLARERRPHVVLMDVHMPGMGGVEATRTIARELPGVAVVIVTASAEEEDVLAAVNAGACGYLLKRASADEIVAGVRAAAAGDSPVSPSIATQLVARVRAAPALRAELTPREREILALLAEGKDNGAIARELYVSPHTVKNAVTEVLQKLGLRNRIEAAVYAVRTGIG